MGKSEVKALEQIKSKLLQFNVELHVHDDLHQDLKCFDPYNLKIIVALILKRAQLGLSIPPAEPLSGKVLNGYAKIKDRRFPYRGVYKSIKLENGNEAMYLIAIGPKNREKIYETARKRTVDSNEFFEL